MVKYKVVPHKDTYVIYRKLGIFKPWEWGVQVTRAYNFGISGKGNKDSDEKEFKQLANATVKVLKLIKEADMKVGIK